MMKKMNGRTRRGWPERKLYDTVNECVIVEKVPEKEREEKPWGKVAQTRYFHGRERLE